MHIHKNLVVSLMIQCILHIIIFEPFITVDLTMEAQDTIDESDSRKSYLGYVSRFFLMNVDKEYIPLNFLGAILAIGREYVSIWL